MKIIYKQGDLLECSEQVIVHGCNAQGVMGSGVAKAIKEKYPEAYRAYRYDYNLERLYKGLCIFVETERNGQPFIVINALTQENYGRDKNTVYVDYDAIQIAFMQINEELSDMGINSVAMPKIGAGLANGDWNIIEKIIEEECTDVQPVVYVLEGEDL